MSKKLRVRVHDADGVELRPRRRSVLIHDLETKGFERDLTEPELLGLATLQDPKCCGQICPKLLDEMDFATRSFGDLVCCLSLGSYRVLVTSGQDQNEATTESSGTTPEGPMSEPIRVAHVELDCMSE
jgi:hypothetical protein